MSYDKFAKQYSDSMGEEGDFYHKTQLDPYIYQIIGNPKGKVIYDLGCGNGYMARELAKKGAHVHASDVSNELLEIAKNKSQGLEIMYSLHDATNFSKYKKEYFDVVVMNMVIHHVQELDVLIRGISRILKKGGVFVFSNDHMFRPTYPYSEWVKEKLFDKEKLFIKVTNYLENYETEVTSGWDDTTKLTVYNRPFNVFVNTMSKYGLYVFRVEEPESKGFAKDYSKELQQSHHIPTFIIVGAIKK